MADWKETADSIKPMINENSLWKQIGYISKDDIDCEPILLTEKHDKNFFPVILEEPTGLNRPKYDRNKGMWVEQDATNNSERLTNAENAIKSANSQVQAAVDASKEVQKTLSDISKGQSDQMEQLANMLKLLAPVLAKENTTTGGAKNA